jgi:hypothetical protein
MMLIMKCEICGKELGELEDGTDFTDKNPIKQLRRKFKENRDRFLKLDGERKLILKHIWTDHQEIMGTMSPLQKKVFLAGLKLAGVNMKQEEKEGVKTD